MKESRTLTVTLETVTPMFLGGADPRGAPELRAPSFRGALRYWLRAALGGVLGDQNLDALRKAEAAVFGSTGSASPIEVHVTDPGLTSQGYNPLPHKTAPFQFKGFQPGQSFGLTLVGRRANAASWRAAVGALLLALGIGGLGRRSRRGFGSLQIKRANFYQAQLPASWQNLIEQTPTSSAEWEFHLAQMLKIVLTGVEELIKHLEFPTDSPSPLSRFPLLNAGSEILLCHHTFCDWEEALKEFGQEEHEFQQQNPGARSAFGSADPRWASPLWVRILPVRGGVILLLTLLWSQSPPRIRANREDLHRFLERCAENWKGQWVVKQEVTR